MATHYIDAVLRLRDHMSAGLQSAGEKLTRSQQTLKAHGKTITQLGNSLQKTGRTLTTHVTVPLVALGAASAKAYTDFEESLTKVSTIADTSEASMGKLRRQIISVSNATGTSASQIAESTYQAISAGVKTGDAVQFVGTATKLAKAGFTDSTTAVDLLTTTLNAYGLKASQATKVSDMLLVTQNKGKTTVSELAQSMGKVIPTAKSYNVTLKDLNSGYVTLTKNGIKTRYATTYLNSMYNELGKSGTKVSQILQQKTGKSFDELMKSGKNTGDVMKILQDYCDDTGTKFSDLWSNANSAKAANTFKNHAKDYNNAMKSMQKAAGTTRKAFEKMEGTSAAQMEKAKVQFQNALITLGAPVMKVLTPIITQLGKFAIKINNWLASLSPKQQQMVVKLAAVAIAIGPVLTVVGKATSAVGNLITNVGKIGNAFSTAGKLIAGFNPQVVLIVAIVAALALVAYAVYKNWDKITAAVKEWWKETVKDVNHIKKKFGELKNKIVETFKKGLAPARRFISYVKRGLKQIGSVFTWIKQKAEDAAQGIKDKFNAVVDFFKKIPERIKDALSGLGESISDAFEGVGSLGNFGGLTVDAGNASGTNNWRGGLTWINEKGPEIVDLPKGTRIYPHDKSMQMARAEGTKTMAVNIPKLADTIVVREESDIDKIATALVRRLEIAKGDLV